MMYIRIGKWLLWLLLFIPYGIFAHSLSDQVIIRRTAYGVPHIYANNLRAAGYAMGYLQLEDHGRRVVDGLVKVRGEWGRYHAVRDRETQIDQDAAALQRHAHASETYPLLHVDTRDMLEGFAEGVNRYIELHPAEFPTWVQPNFSGIDVHAKGIGGYDSEVAKRFIDHKKSQRLEDNEDSYALWSSLPLSEEVTHPEDGSNAWALAPGRTTSGKAILLRNPHLSWGAGYYEAHMIVPGKLNFYGDFRIGSPIGIIGGFNEHIGWSTTNNYPDIDEIYAFEMAVGQPDYFLLDGVAHPLTKREITVDYKDGNTVRKAKREFISTPFGPVIYRDKGHVYIIRTAGDGEYRTSEQFLRMMMARSLQEWKEAMRMHAKTTSNFTYADAKGNIFYVWNAMVPDLPHPPGKDTTAILATRTDQIWQKLFPWDALPQLTNPPGGYLRNENDPFHYTNLNAVFDPKDFPAYFPEASLRLRSQHSLELIADDDKLSLEDVIQRKHSKRMLLADRVKDDLIAAVKQTGATGEMAQAIDLLAAWDNTSAANSRGGILFESWWKRYLRLSNNGRSVPSTPASAGYAAEADSLFAEPWSQQRPTVTPKGLASPSRAVDALEWAIKNCKEQFGGWDVAWGEVHRARMGPKEYPIGGGSGNMGNFRVLTFETHPEDKRKRQVDGGDCWILAVEFGEIPRAYSVLAYGQSSKMDSPYYGDQLALFAADKLKPVAFTEEAVKQQLVREYRPGKAE